MSNVRATTTGPKTSARAISIAVVTFSTMVGAMKRPFGFEPAAAGANLRAALFRRPDVALDLAEMIGADDRADPRLRVERIADLDGLRTLRESGQEFVGDAGVEEQARAGVAAFASIEIGAEGRGVERGVHVRVGEDRAADSCRRAPSRPS